MTASPDSEARKPKASSFADAGFATICTHFGEDYTTQGGAVAPPLFQTSTFVYPDSETFHTRKERPPAQSEYTRLGNPTTALLEGKLAQLERGTWARAFGSGMGAIAGAVQACVKAGDHVVCVKQCYPPSRFFLRRLERFGVTTTYVAGGDPQPFIDAFQDNTKLLYLESPTGGTMDVPPVRALAQFAHERGARVILDNSWATPYFFRPLEHGVDLVVHSATKYFSGHSDVVAGVVVGRDADLRREVHAEAEFGGATLDPFAAWLLVRGLRTLALRMEAHQQSGLAVARLLAESPDVATVFHPGLPSHPHHATAAEQFSGYGSLFGLVLADNSGARAKRFVDHLRLFGIGASWGGYESLAILGPWLPDGAGGTSWLIRLFIGLESLDDLLADVKGALRS